MLLGSIATAQESVDPWFGKSIAQLESSVIRHDDIYKIDIDENTVILTMIDYRRVEVSYNSYDYGETIYERVDKYSASEYKSRIDEIKSTWTKFVQVYILDNEVIAVFSDSRNSIIFMTKDNYINCY